MRESVSAFRSWKKTVLEQLEARQKEIIEHVQGLAPASLNKLFNEDSELVSGVLEYGEARRKYRSGEGQSYGFTNLDDLMARLEELKTAWEGIINVKIYRGELPYKITVDFTAVDTPLPPEHVDLGMTTVLVECVFGDRIVRGQLDVEESFMADVAHAVRDNGKDPVDVIAFLADEGARYGKRNSPSWLNRIGP